MTLPYTPSAVSLTRATLLPLPMALVHKMHIIDSLPRSATGGSLALANSANYSTSRKVISAQLSKKSLPMSPCMFVYLKTPPASCGIILSSNVLPTPVFLIPLTVTYQLRFQEGDWLRWLEKSRSHMLYEFPPSVSLLYALLQKGRCRWHKNTLCSHQRLGGVPNSYRGRTPHRKCVSCIATGVLSPPDIRPARW